MDINRIILTGRLTKDVELKKTQSGKSVVSFTLAVNRNQDTADFIDCTAWERTAEVLAEYAGKGSQIAVEGSIEVRTYEYQGQNRKATEIHVSRIKLLDSRKPNVATTSESVAEVQPTMRITADDLPF